jgi:hypothetical protein
MRCCVRRFRILVFIGCVSLIAWLLMQAVHEAGHVLAAWLTGGTVERMILHPLAISRTDVQPNPQPLLVAWSGPVFGVLAPLGAWAMALAARFRQAWLLQFFAGFCLIANGLYLGVGSFGSIGDAGDIVRHGSPDWALWVFGLLAAPAGLWLWNGLGPHFGLGPRAEEISGRLVLAGLAVLSGTCGIMLLTSP